MTPDHPGKRPDRRQRQAAETRREILDAARRLFTRNGYRATTIADIATEAEVAVQTIYSSVGSKSELLLALMDHAREVAAIPSLDTALGEFTDPLDLPDEGARLHRDLMETNGDVIRLVADTAPFDDDVRRVWEENMETSRNGLATGIRRLDELDALAPWLDVDTAVDVAFVANHLRVYMHYLDLGWDLDEIEEWQRSALTRLLIDPTVVGA